MFLAEHLTLLIILRLLVSHGLGCFIYCWGHLDLGSELLSFLDYWNLKLWKAPLLAFIYLCFCLGERAWEQEVLKIKLKNAPSCRKTHLRVHASNLTVVVEVLLDFSGKMRVWFTVRQENTVHALPHLKMGQVQGQKTYQHMKKSSITYLLLILFIVWDHYHDEKWRCYQSDAFTNNFDNTQT